jgi:hypothetical protein
VLVELSVMEQRYQAVLAVVQDGWKVVEVARRPHIDGLKAWEDGAPRLEDLGRKFASASRYLSATSVPFNGE